jgi:hypothetical protein
MCTTLSGVQWSLVANAVGLRGVSVVLAMEMTHAPGGARPRTHAPHARATLPLLTAVHLRSQQLLLFDSAAAALSTHPPTHARTHAHMRPALTPHSPLPSRVGLSAPTCASTPPYPFKRRAAFN